MCTYLNPNVRKRLVEQGKLFRIDAQGRRISAETGPPEGELSINLLGPIPLPIQLGELAMTVQWYAAVRSTELAQVEALADELKRQGGQRLFAMLATSMAVNSVLIKGDPAHFDNPLVRIHSSCLTGDVFGSQRCECGPQFVSALQRIDDDPNGGMLVYMSGHEGRGIGLWAKAATYLLQDAGEDTYQANRSLGLPEDSRDFTDAGAIIHHFLGSRPFRLLTNNPKKIIDLAHLGVSQVTQVKHVVGVTDWNRRYLAAKRDWGHAMTDDDIQADAERCDDGCSHGGPDESSGDTHA
jgi:GTP cyclohydrolase II